MAKTLLIAGLFLASLVPHAASAQPLPRYDVKAACQVAGADVKGAKGKVNGCLASEKSAYDSLKASWGDLDQETRASCQQVATATGPASYALLLGCVTIESATGSTSATSGMDFEEQGF